MKRKKHFLTVIAFVSTMSLSVSAQTMPEQEAPFQLKKVLPQQKKTDAKFKEVKNFPLLNQMMLAQP